MELITEKIVWPVLGSLLLIERFCKMNSLSKNIQYLVEKTGILLTGIHKNQQA